MPVNAMACLATTYHLSLFTAARKLVPQRATKRHFEKSLA
jgi:hypothetical protein